MTVLNRRTSGRRPSSPPPDHCAIPRAAVWFSFCSTPTDREDRSTPAGRFVEADEEGGRYEASAEARDAAARRRRRRCDGGCDRRLGIWGGTQEDVQRLGVLLQLEPVRNRTDEGRSAGGQGPRRQRHRGDSE